MIVKKRDGYHVLSEKTKRNLGGPYKSRDEAKKRLRQVEYFKHMKKAIVLFAFLLLPLSVFAGGGRFSFDGATTGNVGTNVNFTLQVYIDGTTNPSIGENVEFRIHDSHVGDSCGLTGDSKTDSQGKIYGECTATAAHDVHVYAHSNDHGDESADRVITFIDAPTTAPTIVTQAPTATPALTTTPKPTVDFAASNEPTPQDESPTPEDTATPTPAVAGNFFANPTNVIGLFIFLGILGVGSYFLWEAEKWPFTPERKKKLSGMFNKKGTAPTTEAPPTTAPETTPPVDTQEKG